jgi:23S rRNA (uracil1939-C5)-methyltransferase
MKKGDVIRLEITDVAYGGDGLGRHDGRVIFVPFVIAGEIVEARISRVKKQWAAAELVRVLEPSPHRVPPPCPFFTRCGGCAYQHMSYEQQLAVKTRQVAETLCRVGKIAEPHVEPTRPSPLPLHYRNRLTVHVQPPTVGFHAKSAGQIIDVDQCLLASEPVNAALENLRAKRRLRPGPATLRAGEPGRGFRQVNDEAAEVLAAVVSDLSGEGETLIDAYCGAGFFAKKITGAFRRVLGMDWDERSIHAARENASTSEEYLAGDTALLLPEILSRHPHATVLLDPPAQGLGNPVIETLLAHRPPRIVYVSCDPATLARDLFLLGSAYSLQHAVPVDMFAQTASIETACLLQPRQD